MTRVCCFSQNSMTPDRRENKHIHMLEYFILYFGLFSCGVITGVILMFVDRDKHDVFHMEYVLSSKELALMQNLIRYDLALVNMTGSQYIHGKSKL